MEKDKFISVVISNKSFCERFYHHANKRNAKGLFAISINPNGQLDVFSDIEVIELKKQMEIILRMLNQQKSIILLNN